MSASSPFPPPLPASELLTPLGPPDFMPPPLPPPAPPNAASPLVFTGDQVVATCANTSSPICYNTSISGANLITNLWFSAILGALCYLGFVIFRAKFRFYQARLDMPHVTHKPPALKLKGLYRLWSWLIPVFKVSDEELLLSAGMDALISVRIISFGILLFLPITVAAMAILVPINYLDDYYQRQSSMDGFGDSYTTVFIRLTMSNITPGSPVLWVHTVFVYGMVFYTCWLITEHYKEYITLRQAYVVRSTEIPSNALGGSTGAIDAESQPLLAVRSPLKKKHMLARSSSFDPIGGVRRGKTGSLKLPRRDASASGTADGLTAGVEMITLCMGNGTSNGSRPMEGGNGAGSGGMDAAGPSRLVPQPSRLSAAPFGNTTSTVTGTSSQALPPGADVELGRVRHVRAPSGSGSDGAVVVMDGSGTDGTAFRGPRHGRGKSSGSGSGGMGGQFPHKPVHGSADWTVHDFSNEVLPQNPLPPIGTTPHGAVTDAEEVATPMRTTSALPRGQSGVMPSMPPLWSPPQPGGLRRVPSNAAVAAALDPTARTTSAAEALVKIRHHRAASGASNRSAPTPAGGSTPRANADTISTMPTLTNQAPSGSRPATQPPSPTKAGALVPPPDLSSVITAVSAMADEQEGAANGDLPTVGPVSPDLASPQGQEGVAQRWWGALSGMGNRLMDRRRSQRQMLSTMSITAKGAVPMTQLPGGGVLAANASLYTVLVTDQPIERLRLKKPLGNMEFWHGSNSGNVLGLQATATEELDTSVPSTPLAQRFSAVAPSKSFEFPAPPPQEEGNTPLAAAERGEIGMSTSPGGPSTSANGRGAGHGAGMASPPGSPGRKGANRSSSVFYSSSLASASNDAWSHRHVGNADAEAAERGPTASWSSLRQWWQYKGRYKEWRRDVRWKMFNRRVRTATEMFTELFGDDFDAIIPIYPTDSVDKLISQWDCKCAELERAQVKLREIAANEADEEAKQGRPVERTQRREKQVARLKAKIATLMTKVADLQEKIIRERDAVLSDLPSTCFFATFKSQEAAAIAAQANLNPVSQRLFNVEPAPSPDDVNWPSLTRSWWQRQSRTLYVLPLILLIMLFPIGAFTGAFAQLTIAICGNPMDGSPALAADSWFCSDDPWASFLRNLITSLAPSILLSVYHMVLLPVLVYYAAQAEGQCLSLSKLDRRCADLFFYWDVFNVFLGAMLGGSILAELPTYIKHPEEIWAALSSAIPASSNFFINYVSYRALVMAWFRLFYPHQAILACIVKWMRLVPWAKTPRDKALEAPVRNCRYGRDIGIPVLMNYVMVMAYAVVSPLILPFGLVYFILLWPVWRYQMLYVYQRQYESGGQFWPLVAHKVVGCTLIGVLFTAVVLVLKHAYTQAAVLVVTLPLYLLRFDLYLRNRYDAVVAQVPLMAVHAAGRVATVDPNLWTPPPLRQGATGWNPEWGKVWQWWGVPRSTL